MNVIVPITLDSRRPRQYGLSPLVIRIRKDNVFTSISSDCS